MQTLMERLPASVRERFTEEPLLGLKVGVLMQAIGTVLLSRSIDPERDRLGRNGRAYLEQDA